MRDGGGREGEKKRRSEGRAEGGSGMDIGDKEEVGRERREGEREVEREKGVKEGGSEGRMNGGR